MISEIFASESDSEAEQYLGDGPSAGGVGDAVAAGELTSLELDALQSVLTGEAFGEVLGSEGGGVVVTGGDGGPWVSRIRPALVRALTRVDPEDVAGVAHIWSQRDELDDHSQETLEGILPPLVDLARTVGAGRGLYVWNRLG